jgi:hypothetical protein
VQRRARPSRSNARITPAAILIPTYDTTQQYDYPTYLFQKGDVFIPDTDAPQLTDNEMRITFLGTAFPPMRKAQQMMIFFVELGP